MCEIVAPYQSVLVGEVTMVSVGAADNSLRVAANLF
jgi:hypothetical protein